MIRNTQEPMRVIPPQYPPMYPTRPPKPTDGGAIFNALITMLSAVIAVASFIVLLPNLGLQNHLLDSQTVIVCTLALCATLTAIRNRK